MVVADPILHRTCRDILHDVQRHAGKLSYDDFYLALQPLLIFAPPTDLPAERELKTEWVRIGHKACQGVPKEAFEFGVSEYIRTTLRRQFPAWGLLIKLAEPKTCEIAKCAWRIKLAAEHVVRPTPATRTPEEIAEVAKMLAEFRAAPMPPPLTRYGETKEHMADRLRASA